MSYLKKHRRKKSKLVLVFKADKYDEFPDDIYVRPINQNKTIAWGANFHKYSTVSNADSTNTLILIEMERALYELALMCACTADCESIGDCTDASDIDDFSNLSWPCIRELVAASMKVNKIAQGKHLNDLLKFFDDINAEPEEEKPKPKPKAKRKPVKKTK